MPILIAIVLIILGAFSWNKYGEDLTNIYNSSANIVETSKDEIHVVKKKIKKSLDVIKTQTDKEMDKSITTNQHQRYKKDSRVCHICKKTIKIGVWGNDSICQRCFHRNK